MLPGLVGTGFFGNTASSSDPSFASVVLLTGFEGTDGAVSTFAEESSSAKTVTPQNGCQIDTAQAKFGSSSMLFAGDNDFCSLLDSNDWAFGSGDFTIETWLRFNATTGFKGIAGQYIAGNISWWLQTVSGTSLEFGWSANGTAVSTHSRSWSPSTGVWYHVVAERSGTTMRLYVDGAMLGTSGTNSATLWNSNQSLLIGAVNAQYFNGWMDEFRITKGVARYASDSGYTVPTAAFPRS